MTEARRYFFLPQLTTNFPQVIDRKSLPTPFGSTSPTTLPAPPPSRVLRHITQHTRFLQPQYGPPVRPYRYASHFPRIHTQPPLPNNIYLQTCIDWTTKWTSNPTLLTLLPYRVSFPALLKTLSGFRSVGYRISRLLFIHKRRISNAPYVTVCVCGSCTKDSPCSVDWNAAKAFTKTCQDVEAKLAEELELLKHLKPYVNDQLAYYMINLAAGTHPIIVGSGSAEDALYSFDQWWRCTADEMIANLETLTEKLKAQTPELGKVEMEHETTNADDDLGTPTQTLKQELDRVRYSSPVKEGDDDESSCDTIICFPRPREEGLGDKSMFRGRRLFQDNEDNDGDGEMEVPIVLDVAQEMGPPVKMLQNGFEEVSTVPIAVDKRVISATVWWKGTTV